jgi:hypothetical protein
MEKPVRGILADIKPVLDEPLGYFRDEHNLVIFTTINNKKTKRRKKNGRQSTKRSSSI